MTNQTAAFLHCALEKLDEWRHLPANLWRLLPIESAEQSVVGSKFHGKCLDSGQIGRRLRGLQSNAYSATISWRRVLSSSGMSD